MSQQSSASNHEPAAMRAARWRHCGPSQWRACCMAGEHITGSCPATRCARTLHRRAVSMRCLSNHSEAHLHGAQLFVRALAAQHRLQVVPAGAGKGRNQAPGTTGATRLANCPAAHACGGSATIEKQGAHTSCINTHMHQCAAAHLYASSCAWIVFISAGMSSALSASCSIRSAEGMHTANRAA